MFALEEMSSSSRWRCQGNQVRRQHSVAGEREDLQESNTSLMSVAVSLSGSPRQSGNVAWRRGGSGVNVNRAEEKKKLLASKHQWRLPERGKVATSHGPCGADPPVPYHALHF